MKIRGVNLGNWLVLEKWMEPEMFADTQAEDETTLCKVLPEEEKRRRYTAHRERFITEQDFADIAALGLNTVRIPVPYFLFEDIGPFVHCYEYLDRAFDWAQAYGLKILVDLHTVPGGQNGTDNSGLCGVCTWSTKEEYRRLTLDVLEKLAQRYGSREALWGIEVLNEPMCSDTPIGVGMNIQMLSQIYAPSDSEMAKDNTNYPLDYLRSFYRDAYCRMRKYLPESKAVVFSDAFYPEGWAEFFREEQFHNIVLDTHQYVNMVEYGFGPDRPIARYEAYMEKLCGILTELNATVPVIVGEWSLANSMSGLDALDEDAKDEIMRRFYAAYRKAMDACNGWFYWSWKLKPATPNGRSGVSARTRKRAWRLYKEESVMVSEQMEYVKSMVKSMMDMGFSVKFDGSMDPITLRNVVQAAQENMPQEPGVTIVQEKFGEMDAELSIPENPRDDAIIIYVHGGGMVCGNAFSSRGYASMLAGESSFPVYAFSYRLAPENKYPAAVDDCFEAYKAILAKYPDRALFLIGESAGGYLSLTTALRARDNGVKMPAGVIPYSPVTDWSGTLNRVRQGNKDFTVTPQSLDWLSALFCGDADTKSPQVSPYFDDLHGMPPMLLAWDESETLALDSEDIVAKLERQGIECRHKSYPDCFHAFATTGRGTPESMEILQDTITFINDHI